MSYKRRPRGSEHKQGVRLASPNCGTGKKAYVTRAEARQVAVRIQKQDGGERMSAYKCNVDGGCGYFHIGHLPRAVKRGEITRDEYRKGDAA